jgi:hypothetical protein
VYLPEVFGLVEEEVVSVGLCEEVGGQGQEEVLPEEAVGLGDAELFEEGHHVVLLGQLIDCEAAYCASYMLTPLKM